MRIEKDNLISAGLNIIAIPIAGIYFLFRFLFRQVISLISLVFFELKSKTAKTIAFAIFGYVIFLFS